MAEHHEADVATLDFGFSWEVVPEEPWHIRYTAGDNVPPAVQAWLDSKKVV